MGEVYRATDTRSTASSGTHPGAVTDFPNSISSEINTSAASALNSPHTHGIFAQEITMSPNENGFEFSNARPPERNQMALYFPAAHRENGFGFSTAGSRRAGISTGKCAACPISSSS